MIIKKFRDSGFVKARELKQDSDKWAPTFPSNKQLKQVIIKLEIDTNPLAGAVEENAYLDFPVLHQVKTGSTETLFSGKLYALLCRNFIKGGDWYDLLWYIKKNPGINYKLLKNALFNWAHTRGRNLKK